MTALRLSRWSIGTVQLIERRHGCPLRWKGAVIDSNMDRANHPARTKRVAMELERYTTADLRRELARFEQELRAAHLRESSVRTYVDRTAIFLKWLEGEYQPRGPI
jgi:hypothetical protein